MPIIKSAAKELRKSKKRHLRNIRITSELRTLSKKFAGLVDAKNVQAAKELLRKLSARLDAAASKKIIHKRQASRKKSRMSRRIKKIQP